MNTDDHRDQLVDMLLRELVGGETPPDVRERVMTAAMARSRKSAPQLQTLPVRPTAVPKLAPRPRSPIFAIAAMAAALAGAMLLIHLREVEASRTPALTRTEEWVKHPSRLLSAGESVSTDARTGAVLTYSDGTVVELAANTTVRVPPASWRDRSKKLELVQGALTARVKPQHPGSPMILAAGYARAEVVGTQLAFRHDDGGTRLEVTEGEVRFLPKAGGKALSITTGAFAEAGASGVQSGTIAPPLPKRGIVRFTLMNADTDLPMREQELHDGETLSLASLPTQNLNVRADYEGDAPSSVNITVTRDDGQPPGVPSAASNDQTEPPFFAAGDHWADGRPNDCRAWTPQPGVYRISATATYTAGADARRSPPLDITFRITE